MGQTDQVTDWTSDELSFIFKSQTDYVTKSKIYCLANST